MIKRPGPIEIPAAEEKLRILILEDAELWPPILDERRESCPNYKTCLSIAAALNWIGFTCKGCCCEVDPCLLWRAEGARRKDPIAKVLCEKPSISIIHGNVSNSSPLHGDAPIQGSTQSPPAESSVFEPYPPAQKSKKK